WVHISELRDPTPWLSGGEVLLSTGLQLDTPERQREFVTRLADRHLAALGFGTGFAHAEIPAAILEEAAERDFPVFEVPYELPFIALTEAAFTRLVNEQYAVLRRALAAQERLERIVLSERGLDALATALAALVGGAVLVFDPRGEQRAGHAFRRPLDAEEIRAIAADLRERGRRRDARTFMPALEDPSRALAIPVASEAGSGSGMPAPEAWLVAVKDDAPLSDFDRLVLRQAVTIVALELLRERVADDTERRLAGDVLAGVLTGELSGAELQRRLEPFGLPGTVAVLALPKPGSASNGNGRGPSLQVSEAALAAALRAEATPALVASSGQSIALIPGMDEQSLFALAERVADRVRRDLGLQRVRVGVGRAVPGGEARRSYHEARCTLEALELGLGGRDAKIATYRDLGSFQLLLSLQDDESLKLFCDSILGPIERSEGYYGGELMRSLEAFIEENGQWERAAKRLYCHRHTLRYRIRRVEELTGRDLGCARDRIEFWLALRGRELTAA
ncbi:MAG TPA: PucR family transcriptional regulator ligand-binding domain-containing protein, partial [Solirubrobacteraceae bacterium]|nr:PucR family transcriptional regulator ligand-binding domain-containing protein [Solirubrobacteraceae bacterium]